MLFTTFLKPKFSLSPISRGHPVRMVHKLDCRSVVKKKRLGKLGSRSTSFLFFPSCLGECCNAVLLQSTFNDLTFIFGWTCPLSFYAKTNTCDADIRHPCACFSYNKYKDMQTELNDRVDVKLLSFFVRKKTLQTFWGHPTWESLVSPLILHMSLFIQSLNPMLRSSI